MKKLAIGILGTALSAFSVARAEQEKQISVSTKMYPVAMDIVGWHLEDQIKSEASTACGDRAVMTAVKDVKIEVFAQNVVKGLETKKRESLTLFYPDIRITATVICDGK